MHGLSQAVAAVLLIRVGDQSVFGLFEGAQDRRLVCGRSLANPSILDFDVRSNLAAGEYRQTHRRTDTKIVAEPNRKVVQLCRLPPGRSQECEARKVIGL